MSNIYSFIHVCTASFIIYISIYHSIFSPVCWLAGVSFLEVVETEMKKLWRNIYYDAATQDLRSVHSSMPKKSLPPRQKVVNTHKHRESELSPKWSVRDKTLFEEQHDLRDKTLFEEQHDLLYRAIYLIDNCTKENLKITVRPVVDTVKNLNGKNQCYRKKRFASGED